VKALFVTTHTNDTHNHVDAWDSAFGVPAKRVVFNYRGGVGNDTYIRNKAKAAGDVDVIFYIGCNRGDGLPSFATALGTLSLSTIARRSVSIYRSASTAIPSRPSIW
jgi:hypothetical protein